MTEIKQGATPSPAPVSAHSPAGGVREAVTVEWIEKAREIYERCKFWPERTADGLMALLELRNHVFAALSSPATPEPERPDHERQSTLIRDFVERQIEAATPGPVSAPAGEVVAAIALALEPKCRAFTGGANQLAVNVARELAQVAYAALSNPAPGHGEGVAVAWQRFHPTQGKWIDVHPEDLEHYRREGQEIRSLGVIAHPATGEKEGRS